jgi:hypothetical protein
VNLGKEWTFTMTRSLLLFALLALPVPAYAQSGGAALHGWVAFEGVAYVDPQPVALVELRNVSRDSAVAYTTKTDEHGFYHFSRIGLGEFDLRITAPGYKRYDALVYVPSDFVGNWAVRLKKR